MNTICVFGDSLAKGVVLDSIKNRYTYLKESFLNLVSQKTGICFTNYAKFGCDIKRGYEIILKHEDELSKYDYVFTEFGGNDCNFDWASISEAPDCEHLPHTPLDEFISSYRKLIEKIIDFGGTPVMLSLPPLDSDKFFKWVSKGNNPDNILKWLGDVDHIFRWHKSYSESICELAHDMDVPLLDIRSAFLGESNFSQYICDDGMHLNSKGHRLISKKVAEFCAA